MKKVCFVLLLIKCSFANSQDKLFMSIDGSIGSSNHIFKDNAGTSSKIGGCYSLSVGERFDNISLSAGFGVLMTGVDLKITQEQLNQFILPIQVTVISKSSGVQPFFKLSAIPSRIMLVTFSENEQDLLKIYEPTENKWNFNVSGSAGVRVPLKSGSIDIGITYLRSLTSIQKNYSEYPQLLAGTITITR